MALPTFPSLHDGAAGARSNSEQPTEPWHCHVHGQQTNRQGSLVLASKEQLLLNHPEARPSHFICYNTAVSRILSKCFCKNLYNTVFLPPPRPRAQDPGLFFENMIKERLSWIKIWVPLFINV